MTSRTSISLALFCFAQLPLASIISSALAADGVLGESSTGRAYVSLRIGSTEIGQLSSDISSKLTATSSTNFPVCIGYIDSQFVSINVADLNQEGMTLTSADGTKVPYQISLGTDSESGLEEAKIRAVSDSNCGAGSGLSVNVTLLPTADQEDLGSINGTFNFLVKSE